MMAAINPKTLSLADLRANDATAKDTGRECRFLCPLPECAGKPADQAHRSLAANLDNGAWSCYRCGAAGKLAEYRTKQAAEQPRPTSQSRGKAALLRNISTPQRTPPIPPDQDKERAWRTIKLLRIIDTQAAEYLVGRSIPFELADEAQVRYAPNWYGRPAIVFPIRDHSRKLVAAQGRYIDGDIKGRQKMATGGQLKLGSFSTPGAWESPVIVITEGPFDALSLAAASLPAIALCGKDVRSDIVKRCAMRQVWLAFDTDQAGEEAAAKWIADLQRYGSTVHRLKSGTAKDWNELLQKIGLDAMSDLLPKRPNDAPRATESVSGRSDDVSHVLAGTNTVAAKLCREMLALIESKADRQQLREKYAEFDGACDLSDGYTDTTDDFADCTKTSLKIEIDKLA
jgi:5S rRNA maturation endonuclease (ribonuclease M5)